MVGVAPGRPSPASRSSMACPRTRPWRSCARSYHPAAVETPWQKRFVQRFGGPDVPVNTGDPSPNPAAPAFRQPRRPVVRWRSPIRKAAPMRSRPTRLALAAVAALAVAGLGAPALTSPAAAGPVKAASRKARQADGGPLRHLQRLAQPRHRGPAGRGPVRAGQRAGVRRRGDDPARRRGRHPRQRVRLRRGRRGGRAVPRQLPRGRPERRRSRGLPLLLRRAVQHRASPPASTSTTTGRHRRAGDDAVRLRPVPGPVRHGRLLEVPDRGRRRPHLPALPLEGHAGRRAARRPGDSPARPTGTPPRSSPSSGCPRSRTGTCRSSCPAQAGPLPRLPPDAAHLRRRRGPQRPAQPRRDPLLGRLRHAAGAPRPTSTTTRVRPVASGTGRTS